MARLANVALKYFVLLLALDMFVVAQSRYSARRYMTGSLTSINRGKDLGHISMPSVGGLD